MSFFLGSAHRLVGNSTRNDSLMSNFQKSVEKVGRALHDEYNSIQGKRAAQDRSNFAIYRTSKDSHVPTD